MTDTQYKECTAKIKALADIRKLALDDTDSIIRAFYSNVHGGEEQPLIPGLTAEEERILELETPPAKNGESNGTNGTHTKKRKAEEEKILELEISQAKNGESNGTNGTHTKKRKVET